MKIENNSTFVMIDNKYIKDGDYILTSEQLTVLALASMNLSCKGTCIYFNNLDNGHAQLLKKQ